jgi:hypothetical protein
MVVLLLTPLNPPLKQVCLLPSISMMFERETQLERGLRPLSSIFPLQPESLASNYRH